MSNEEYDQIMSKTIHDIYDKVKNTYIVKEHLQDSKDVTINIWFYIENKKSLDGYKPIGGYTINYLPLFDKKEWPPINQTSFLSEND